MTTDPQSGPIDAASIDAAGSAAVKSTDAAAQPAAAPQPPAEHDIEQRLRTAIENDIRLLEDLYRFLHECWVGTGSDHEDGSASNDYRLRRDECADRAAHLRWMLRDLDALGAIGLLRRRAGGRNAADTPLDTAAVRL